jgi:hypothetical protein
VRRGIRIDAGNTTSADDAVCLDMSGNTTAGSGSTAVAEAFLSGLMRGGDHPAFHSVTANRRPAAAARWLLSYASSRQQPPATASQNWRGIGCRGFAIEDQATDGLDAGVANAA